MKKIYSLILVAASLAVAACQPKELDDIVPDVNPDVKSVKIIATIEDIDATKVDYAFNDNSIKPTWAVDDILFGFYENGTKFTYKVTEIVGDEATIEDVSETPYEPALGTTVYGIYYPGKGVGDITGATGEESLAIDLAGQDGTLSGTSPAIMCATATVTEGADGNEIRFKFKNQTAIIGLTKIQVGSKDSSNLQVNTPVTQIAIEGVVTHGSLSVVNDSLTLTPGTKASTVYAVPATSYWVTDDKGQIDFVTEFNAPIAFAVLPKESSEPTVYAYTSTAAFKNSKAVGSKEMAAGHYYYMSKKLDASAAPVASLTVGDVTSQYYNVSDAFDAADCSNADCTVKLLADCATTRTPNIRSSHGTGDITIDLNGKTLTMSHQFGVYDSNITICDNSSAVLAEQGKITSAVTYAAYYFSGSSLTLAGGTLENTANSQYALYLTGTSNATISGGCVKSTNYRGIYQGSGCDLTMTGGKVEAHGNAIVCNAGRTGATNLDVKGNAIVNSDSTALYVSAGVVSVSGSAQISSDYRYSIYVISGSATISGNCSFENEGYVLYTHKAQGIDAPTVNIEGGYFSNVKNGWTSANSPIYANYGTINISAGHFTANGVNPLGASSNGAINATGGYYNKAINSERLGDTYCNIASSEPEYDFLVDEATAVASVEASNYTFKHGSLESVALQLSERMANVSVSPVVTMLTDVTGLESTFTPVAKAGESVTLNLDGHVISAESLSPVVSTSTDLIISENGNGEIITGGATALAVTGGTTTINGASLVGATNAVSVAADATLTVNNGYFYGAQNGDDIAGAEGATVTLAAGWYRNQPSADYLAEGTKAQSGSEDHNNRTYNWTIGVETAVVTVNGEGYASLGAAVAAASALDGEAESVTIQLQDDITHSDQIDLTNTNNKPIVLDLNGHTLTTTTESFITTGGTLTITDNGQTKGKITSSASKVLDLTSSSADVTLNGCKIVSTKETGSDYYSDAAILMNDSSAKLTVTEATIYTTGGLTTISNRAGSLTISDSEISSGTESTGLIAVCNGLANASTTINSGSFYTSSTTANRPVVYTGSSAGSSSTAGSVTINDGYFYFAGDTRDVRASYSAQNDKITINGGYFAHDLSWTKDPTYGSGKSLQAIDPAETHTHATTGDELSYGYQVKETPIVDVADVNGTTYTSFEDALAAANAYGGADETVTLTLLSDVSVDHATFNHASKNMTLDINGHTLSGTDSAAVRYTVSKTFNIVDNGAVKGKITSTKENVVAKAGSSAATINITGCTITSSATGMDYYHEAVVYFFNAAATLNITNCVIYSTGSLTGVTVIAGTANISGSEISSGTESTGLVGVCAYNAAASVTINSGCFYTSNTTSTRPAAYAASGTFTINDGFFYGGTTSIRTGTLANLPDKFTVKGGYFNCEPIVTSKGIDYTPTYDGCSLESVSKTYTHSIKGTLNFSYQAVSSAGEASVEASTSTPVVSLGEARNGGVSF